MHKNLIPTILSSLAISLTLVACGKQTTSGQSQESQPIENVAASEPTEDTEATATRGEKQPVQTNEPAASGIGTVPNDLAEDEAALVATYPSAFTQETYTDPDTGLTVTYNLFLPAGYDASASYPMVVFIADSSCARGDALQSLTQGRGALVWATDAWQQTHPTIVCVPTYPETILDDHDSYTTTDYVELTKHLIESVSSTYAVDADRIYGTGQSMGCMTTLILASEHPDLYAACMFVNGQWDVSTLASLEGQRFVYFAAEDDERAFTGMSEVMARFNADSHPFASTQWQGSWSPDELSTAANELFAEGKDANFVSWAAGSIEAGQGGMGGASYHMASFDYAYRCIAVMEWLFQQA